MMALLPCGVHALVVRDFMATVHKRLLNFPELVYEVTPSPNPDFIADASKFHGIGWPESPTDWTRQMALVSPRHLLCATHYTLDPDWEIIFVGTDNAQHLHGIQSQTPIINTLGQQTDLMLVTLSTPVDTSLGILPFPVLNLPTEADYVGKPLLVCGSFVDSGTATIGGLITLVNDPGFDTTRFIYFDYDENDGQSHDCKLYYGDSGAPSFVMVNGQPAIVGTASAFDDLTPHDGIVGPVIRSYISSAAGYLSELDTLMEAEGCHIQRFYPETTSLGVTAAPEGVLRRLEPGGISVAVQNFGVADAHNVGLVLTFGTAPTTVSGAGWICEVESPLVWRCRRGGIAGAASSVIDAAWSGLPATGDLEVAIVQSHDGGTEETYGFSLPVLETFGTWVQGAADMTEHGDSDGDGISNLLEYAFGGSPLVNSLTAAGGHPLVPQVAVDGDRLLVRYPRRTDAAARGITGMLEFSGDPAADGWDSEPPAGTTVEAAEYAPPSPGFEQVTVSVPMDVARRFARVKVALAE